MPQTCQNTLCLIFQTTESTDKRRQKVEHFKSVIWLFPGRIEWNNRHPTRQTWCPVDHRPSRKVGHQNAEKGTLMRHWDTSASRTQVKCTEQHGLLLLLMMTMLMMMTMRLAEWDPTGRRIQDPHHIDRWSHVDQKLSPAQLRRARAQPVHLCGGHRRALQTSSAYSAATQKLHDCRPQCWPASAATLSVRVSCLCGIWASQECAMMRMRRYDRRMHRHAGCRGCSLCYCNLESNRRRLLRPRLQLIRPMCQSLHKDRWQG